MTVTPVPEAAVKNIAGSIDPVDYPVVDGSTATLPLSQALYSLATGADAEAAEKAIVHTKTTNSYYRLYDGGADLLIVYEPPEEIITRMQTENLLVKPIGLDALVFMANADNPVKFLTTEQLIDIYSGKIKNWEDVGGKDQRLLAFQRPVGSGSQTLMQKLVMGDVPMEEGDNIFRYSTMADILEGMIAYNGEANTLGYSVFYYANYMYSLPELRFMGVNSVIPSTKTIYDGSYPFVNAFYAVIRPDEPEDSNARILFDWLTGEAGQQMVLDLGYVPVNMPEHAELVEKEPGREEELLLTPKEKLAPGQHYIFVQEEVTPNNNYGDVRIYDENWNCCASFSSASCYTKGVTNARYVSIYRWEAKPEDGGEYWADTQNRLFIYDLQENEFIDFRGIVGDSYVSILDGERGYFKYAKDYDDVNIIDRDGKVLLSGIEMGESDGMIYRERDFYVANYWSGEMGISSKIFDLDLNLKTIIYQSRENMPQEKDRIKGVGYAVGSDGYVLSRTGDILLSPERFLAQFGKEGIAECKIDEGYSCYYDNNDPKKLYRVDYAEEVWYVDEKLNVYLKLDVFLKQGIERLTIRDKALADAPYYMMKKGGVTWYFSPEGYLILEDSSEGARMASVGESYIIAIPREGGYDVDMVVSEEQDLRTFQYRSSRAEYDEIQYLEPYVIALSGHVVNNGKDELVIARKSQTETFTAQKISLEQVGSEYGQQPENVWLVCMYDGDRQMADVNGKWGESQTYAVVSGGGLRFTTPEPGRLIACHNGYLQVDAGSYSYVYDYDGNQIIKAYNRFLMDE